MRGLLRGGDWLENKVFFPRIVFCDFDIRYLGDNNPKFTVSVLTRAKIYGRLSILGSMHATGESLQ